MTVATTDAKGARPGIPPGLLASLAGLAAAWIAFDLLVWALRRVAPRAARRCSSPARGARLRSGAGPLQGDAAALHGRRDRCRAPCGALQHRRRRPAGGRGARRRAPSAPRSRRAFRGVVAIPLLDRDRGALAGGAWAAPPALLRARLGVHEVISTIMMNRIGEAFVAFALARGWRSKGTVRTGGPAPRRPRASPRRPLRASYAAARRASQSYSPSQSRSRSRGASRVCASCREIALVGMNRVACAAEHMPVARRLAQAMLLSGAIAGLSTTATVLGYKGHFESGLGAGAGFGGIAVAHARARERAGPRRVGAALRHARARGARHQRARPDGSDAGSRGGHHRRRGPRRRARAREPCASAFRRSLGRKARGRMRSGERAHVRRADRAHGGPVCLRCARRRVERTERRREHRARRDAARRRPRRGRRRSTRPGARGSASLSACAVAAAMGLAHAATFVFGRV